MIAPETPLILGSASPRRREILLGLGLPVRVLPPGAEEAPWQGEPLLEYIGSVVEMKLRAVASQLAGRRFGAVLVADTVVVVGDQVLGKPESVEDAQRLLRRLVGRTHAVYTHYLLAAPARPEAPLVARTVCSRVTMRLATDEEVAGYARTGEGLDKAGAYAVQGIGSFLVQSIQGSYSNVVGLPACELVLDLKQNGLLGAYP